LENSRGENYLKEVPKFFVNSKNLNLSEKEKKSEKN